MSHLFVTLLSILSFGSHTPAIATSTASASSTTSAVVTHYEVKVAMSTCLANQSLPDPVCTPDAVFPVTAENVCVSGYSASVRDVPDSLKKQVFQEYGISYDLSTNYEVDHLVSLELGGSNDITNLWPEAHSIKSGSFVKDGLENHLHSEVCKGHMTLAQAQSEISGDWTKYYVAWRANSAIPAVPIAQPSNMAKSSSASDQKAGTADTSAPAVKKSSTGICHPQGEQYYARTVTYTAYNSMAECLASGGRTSK